MGRYKNSFATPFVEQAVKWSSLFYKILYPDPIHIYVKRGLFYFKVDNIFQLKYIPFIISTFGLTFLLMIGTCVALPILQKIQHDSKITVVSIVLAILFSACAILEVGTYYLMCCMSPEIETSLNQLSLNERICKIM